MPPRKHTRDEELARIAATMRVSDPSKDNGAFSSLTDGDVIQWLLLLGMKERDPNFATIKDSSEQRELGLKKLRLALWDVQRLDLLFPNHVCSETPSLRLSRLPSWSKWQDPHPELRTGGGLKVDGYADAERLNSYVMTHFSTMAFTQLEHVQGVPVNPPKGIKGAWIGSKKIMANASLDITREGGKDTPFVTYFSSDKGPGTCLLLMEILDVKQVAWPEPGPQFLKELKGHQQTKFGGPADGPLNPMMKTPQVPLIIVRYSYLEGRPAGGSQFTVHLESRLKETLPRGTSAAAVRTEFQQHLASGEEMPEDHIRMFGRLLSHNAGLVDQEWSNDLQGHWYVSKEVEKETRISFFVPCPRMRFRALEEIESGIPAVPITVCGSCGKNATKLMCSSCKAVCYCSAECSKADWPEHKADCKFSKKLVDGSSSLPKNKLYIPTRSYLNFVLDFGFANEQETVKYGGAPVDNCPRNEYGTQRFICRAHMPRSGKGQWDPMQAKVVYHNQGGGTVFMFDRRRSVLVRIGPTERRIARERGIVIPFHEEGYQKLAELIMNQGLQRELLYVWAKRVGDCLEIDLEEIPEQSNIRWD